MKGKLGKGAREIWRSMMEMGRRGIGPKLEEEGFLKGVFPKERGKNLQV